jgi:hypothetical protein
MPFGNGKSMINPRRNQDISSCSCPVTHVKVLIPFMKTLENPDIVIGR